MNAAVPYSSQQAGGAQSRAIPYWSRQFGIGSSHGYAAFEWLGSTWCLRGWSQQPPLESRRSQPLNLFRNGLLGEWWTSTMLAIMNVNLKYSFGSVVSIR